MEGELRFGALLLVPGVPTALLVPSSRERGRDSWRGSAVAFRRRSAVRCVSGLPGAAGEAATARCSYTAISFCLSREEIQDFLNCIDASLEELQAMLSGKQYNFGSEGFSDVSVFIFSDF